MAQEKSYSCFCLFLLLYERHEVPFGQEILRLLLRFEEDEVIDMVSDPSIDFEIRDEEKPSEADRLDLRIREFDEAPPEVDGNAVRRDGLAESRLGECLPKAEREEN